MPQSLSRTADQVHGAQREKNATEIIPLSLPLYLCLFHVDFVVVSRAPKDERP